MNDTINRYLAILCYPFASLDFFLEDYLENIIREERTENRCKRAKERLQEAMIEHMQESCSVYSYDEAYMYLEKCYLHDIRTKRYRKASSLYLDCLEKIVRSMISQRDGKIAFKYWENRSDEGFLGGFGDANKIFLFHGMNMHIPLDFLIMLYMAQNEENHIGNLQHYYNQIEIADQQLAAILQSGVAENHLHKGVSVSFFEIWEAFMLPLNSDSIAAIKSSDLSLGNNRIRTGEVLFFILVAGIVRIFLALALQGNQWNDWEDDALNELVNRFIDGKGLRDFYQERWGGREETEKKNVWNEVLSYCQEKWDRVLEILPKQTEERSLIREIFRVPEQMYTADELILLFYGMRYFREHVRQQENEDERIYGDKERTVKCLLQYLRIKNYVFGCTVQKKNIRGLDYFQKEYYQKDAKLNRFYAAVLSSLYHKKSKVAYWEQAMRKQFQNRDLKKIEFRTSIDDNESVFRKNVRDFLEAYHNVIRKDYCREEKMPFGEASYDRICRTFPRVGLVFHLLKCEDKTVPFKCFLDGVEDKEKLQFGVLEEQYVEQIRIMNKLRDEVRGLDRYIVGLDAASIESATPVWVFVKAYERARDSTIETIGYGEDRRQSLRFTFHAGEDFRHMLSGLRRVDEAITFLKFHAGDRIGHGTVLGISPEHWWRHNPFVVMPRSEALDNYIWAYYVLSRDTVECSSTLLAYLERRVYELAKGIYGKAQNISLQVLVEGYLKLFDDKRECANRCIEAKDVGFCQAVRDDTCDEVLWNGEKIALSRHCKKFLTQMECPIHYEVTKQDILITEMLQNILRKKLSRDGIIVEVNPSSNIAIGEVDKITENQIYQLNVPDGEDNVMVCINSDDPTVFHTNVSNELAYIYYGMLRNGAGRETALAWIDKIRECGIKASFLQGEETEQQIYEDLRRILKML